MVRRRVICRECHGTLRLRLEQDPRLTYHRCYPRPRPSRWSTPDPGEDRWPTLEEQWLDAFESHSGGVAPPTVEEARAETDTSKRRRDYNRRPRSDIGTDETEEDDRT